MYGKMKGKIVFADILEHVESLDVKTASHIDGNNLVIAIVTPVAERVHQLVPQSGEIAFMDASGGMDRYGTQVVMIMTHTPLGGGLPLGSIFLTSKKSEHMKKGLTMLSDLLGGNAFYGRGKNGPCVFMTDHCEAERKAIREVYPTSTPLLCAFHILQAFWRFLWDKQSGVEKGDRPHIFNLMKGLLYAESVPQLEDKYNIMQSAIVAQNPAVQDHLTKYWSMKEDWALALRQDMLVRGSNTNNIVECCFRSLNDKILRRQKCFNVVQLLNYTAVFVSKYFCRKLLQLISNPGAAAASSSSRKALMKGAEISSEGITYIEGDTNKILTHYVDTSIGTCTA
ncbi:hypothetical protein EGW08_012712 [Elysia chlorotica]|uniref:MULE transposase domain-containing protein n=1 Tax=Elysia chlorotica TaxID=188477 RepID=A0A3S0ZI97_ELYCH|nr:hypothetical protein EGW08_012712 [Elysia chlorotica]